MTSKWDIHRSDCLAFSPWLGPRSVEIVQHLQTIRKDCSSVKQIVLSGGVFQNELLAQLLESQLQKQGLSVLRPAKIPCNDGGISLGQAMIAAARILRP